MQFSSFSEGLTALKVGIEMKEQFFADRTFETPITYLNKGQAYAVSMSDSMSHGPAAGPIKYRTVI